MTSESLTIALSCAGVALLCAILIVARARRAQRAPVVTSGDATATDLWQRVDRDDSVTHELAIGKVQPEARHRGTQVVRGTVDGTDFVSYRHEIIIDRVDPEDGTRFAHRNAYNVLRIRLTVDVPRLRVAPDFSDHESPVDIDIDNEDFNRLWSPYGSRADFARAVLTPSVVERLLQETWVGNGAIVIDGCYLAWVKPAGLPEDVAVDLAHLSALRDLIPSHVWVTFDSAARP